MPRAIAGVNRVDPLLVPESPRKAVVLKTLGLAFTAQPFKVQAARGFLDDGLDGGKESPL